MVAYIVWGFFSFLITVAMSAMSECGYLNHYKSIVNVVTLVIGVDFGNFDVRRTGFGLTGVAVLFLFPCLASLLPAAVCGFIANFALEKKFELKCSEDIISDICFDDSFGCCEVISSHDVTNSYAFLGGMASNILATWAIIRICGYLLITAFPKLALY